MAIMPASYPTIEDRFAAYLKDPIWVCWKGVIRAGRQTKLPINAGSGRAASVTRPETWCDYAAARRCRAMSGIGIVLTSAGNGQRLVGFDLDTCRDPQTGEIASWARAILGTLVSYAEISPSGSGLKIFASMQAEEWTLASRLLGEGAAGAPRLGAPRLGATWKESGGSHPAGLEIYLGGRYFAVTGASLVHEPVNAICAGDIERVATLAGKIFPKSMAAPRHAPGARGHGRDFSESGRAFRICLAAVRAHVAMADVPAWADGQLVRTGEERYRVAADYWTRARGEGTQLDRDYARAALLIEQESGRA